MAEGTLISLPLVEEQGKYGNLQADLHMCSPGKGRKDRMSFLEEDVTEHTAQEHSLKWEVADKYSSYELNVVEDKSTRHKKHSLPGTLKKAKELQIDFEDKTILPLSISGPQGTSHHRTSQGRLTSPVVARARAFTESFLTGPEDNTDTHGKVFREKLSYIYRQNKQVSKLNYDNGAARQILQEAQNLINDLNARIERRNKHLKERNEKEGDLAQVVESMRRERDEKLFEYKIILKAMNDALTDKETTLEDTELERSQAESLYQKHLKENTELMKKIELREKQIKQLKERAAKAKKWKDEVRS